MLLRGCTALLMLCGMHRKARVPCLQAAGREEGGGGWSIAAGWDGVTSWGGRQWEEWRDRPAHWWEATKQTAGELKEQPGRWWDATKQSAEGWRERLSWQGVEEWQQRHWAAFEERQKARLQALKEQQEAKFEAWEERQRLHIARGEQRVPREIAAFQEW